MRPIRNNRGIISKSIALGMACLLFANTWAYSSDSLSFSQSTTLAPESRLKPFFEKHGLIFQNLVAVSEAAGKLRSIIKSGEVRESHIRRLNTILKEKSSREGGVQIDDRTKTGRLASGKQYVIAVFDFKKEGKKIDVLFLKDYTNSANFTTEDLKELRNLGVKTKTDIDQLDYPGLEGVWFINPSTAESGQTAPTKILDLGVRHHDLKEFGLHQIKYGSQFTVETKDKWPFVMKLFIHDQSEGIDAGETLNSCELARQTLGTIVPDFVYMRFREWGGDGLAIGMRKVELYDLTTQIEKTLSVGNVADAKRMLRENVDLIVKIFRRGIFAYDIKLANFGIYQNQQILLDLGFLKKQYDESDVKQFDIYVSRNYDLLARSLNSKELADYYLEVLRSRGLLGISQTQETLETIYRTDEPVPVTDISDEIMRSLPFSEMRVLPFDVKKENNPTAQPSKEYSVTPIVSLHTEADKIHAENLNHTPTILEKSILCHIITDSIVPSEQQNMLKVSIGQNMEKEASEGADYREGFACLPSANAGNPTEYIRDLQTLMQKKRNDYIGLGYTNVRFDVACTNTKLVSAILGSTLGVKALAFEPCKGVDFNFAQVEGIMLALRALDSGDIVKLKNAFIRLSGNRLSPEQLAIMDVDRFIITVSFILPAAKIKDYNDRKRINDLITTNIKQAA